MSYIVKDISLPSLSAVVTSLDESGPGEYSTTHFSWRISTPHEVSNLSFSIEGSVRDPTEWHYYVNVYGHLYPETIQYSDQNVYISTLNMQYFEWIELYSGAFGTPTSLNHLYGGFTLWPAQVNTLFLTYEEGVEEDYPYMPYWNVTLEAYGTFPDASYAHYFPVPEPSLLSLLLVGLGFAQRCRRLPRRK